MSQLQKFTLSELKEMLDGRHEQMASNFISEHLLVVSNPPIHRLLSRLSSEPYLLPEMRVMVLKKGYACPTVNLLPQRFEAGELVFLSHNSIVQIGDYADEMVGFGVSMTDELLSLAFSGDVPGLFDGHVRDVHFQLTPNQMQQIEQIHTLLYNILRSGSYSSKSVLHMVSAFLWQVHHLYESSAAQHRSVQSREHRLFTDFVQLVSKYGPQHHNIDFYADQLFLSPRYMSTLVKRVSGKAAKEWIDDAIIIRVKVELRHSDKTVAQISDEMNFPNPSFFCKYFKRLTGLTPQAYRQG